MSEDSLEPLITQCPTCRTRFRVTEAQLNLAAGRVRCGACLSVFAGVEHLVLGAGPRLPPGESPNEALDALLDELRAGTPKPKSDARTVDAKQPREASQGRTSRDDHPPAKPLVVEKRVPPPADRDDIDENGAEFDEPSEVADEVDRDFDVADRSAARGDRVARADAGAHEPRREARPRAPERPRETQPSPSDSPPAPATPTAGVALAIGPEDLLEPRRRKRRWWIPVAGFAGLILLAAQVLYFQFDVWAKNPDIRPVYEWLCPTLHCQLPVMRSLDDIRSKNLVVRDDPNVPGQLMVDALIVNQARFAQPFPVIELRFSSMDGRPLAALRFKPEEYLAGELKGATTFPPLTPVHIALTIADPGADAVSYYIQFR